MADRNKFEEMLERLINEDREGAEELFHEIVVEKSRNIYESLLESDLEEIEEESDEEVDEAAKEDDDKEVDEAADEDKDDEEVDENFDLDEFEVEGDDAPMGGDATDDMMGDLEMGDDDEGDMDDMGGEEGLEDRVVDLEDALDELKAEFEKMMAGEEGEDEESDDGDMDDMGDDEDEEGEEKEAFNFGEAEEETDEEEVEESKQPKSDIDVMKEYVQKVTAKMGDNGVNTKSTVAGKNDMGGTTANIVKKGESTTGGTQGGLAAPSTKEENMGNVNVPGGKASKSMKAMPKGHGAEKKGAGETADNKKSIVGK